MKNLILSVLILLIVISTINAQTLEGIIKKDSFKIEYSFHSSELSDWELEIKASGPNNFSREVFYHIYKNSSMWSFCKISKILSYKQKAHYEVFEETFPIIPGKVTKNLLEAYLREQIFAEKDRESRFLEKIKEKENWKVYQVKCPEKPPVYNN